MNAEEVLSRALETLKMRVTKVFPEQIRRCLDELGDDQIWWRPNEASNSVGNIVIHITGSLNHYLNRQIGGFPYDRDREAEFAERRHIPKAEVRAMFDAMVAKAEQTFDALTPARFGDPSPEPKMNKIVLDDVMQIAVHIANHAGQIVWITKMLKEGAAHEVWIKTHKELGAWGG